jgi:hypothetical protein
LVYGFLSFDKGRMERLFFDNVGNIGPNWPPETNGYIDPPRPLQTYLLRDRPMGLAEASWWPDFPTAAQNAIEIYHTNSGTQEPIDGVIGINFLTLEKLMEVLGPITVEKYDVTVSSQDVTDKTLIITHPEGTRPWETDRYDFVGYLAREVIDRALSSDASKWAPMSSALRTLGREKNLLLYHTDPTVQEVIADFGWDGGLETGDGDYLMVVDSSLRSTKLNLVVEPRIDLMSASTGRKRNRRRHRHLRQRLLSMVSGKGPPSGGARHRPRFPPAVWRLLTPSGAVRHHTQGSSRGRDPRGGGGHLV